MSSAYSESFSFTRFDQNGENINPSHHATLLVKNFSKGLMISLLETGSSGSAPCLDEMSTCLCDEVAVKFIGRITGPETVHIVLYKSKTDCFSFCRTIY